MALIALGLNHLTAPLEFRERVAFSPDDTASALASLTAQPGVREAAILSTCNRTELYCNVERGNEAAQGEWLQRHHELTRERLGEFLYRHNRGRRGAASLSRRDRPSNRWCSASRRSWVR